MDRYRITAVSYLNTKPLLYGLLNSPIGGQLDLELNIPSDCAQKLKNGQADLALVPVAIIPELQQPRIISRYCIGAVGEVRTVCIYSDCPLEEAETLYLDHHSRTSVELAQLLLKEYWHLSPALLPAQEGYIRKIGGRTAGLVIGDRTIGLDKKFKYCYDLGEAWQQHTGLPFVFAAWVSTREFNEPFLQAFNDALASGVSQIQKLKYLLPSPAPDFSLEEYFTRYISYQLDEAKEEALQRFLSYLNEKQGAPKPMPVFQR